MKETEAHMYDRDANDDDEDHGPLEDWEILTEIVIALVDRPERVRVEDAVEDGVINYLIHVAPDDVGKVIGKRGETVGLLRNLFGRIASKRGLRVNVHVADPNNTGGYIRPSPPYAQVPPTYRYRRIAAA